MAASQSAAFVKNVDADPHNRMLQSITPHPSPPYLVQANTLDYNCLIETVHYKGYKADRRVFVLASSSHSAALLQPLGRLVYG